METFSLEADRSLVDCLHFSLPGCLRLLVVQVGTQHRAGKCDGQVNPLDETQLCIFTSHLLAGVLCISGSEEVVGAVCESSLAW